VREVTEEAKAEMGPSSKSIESAEGISHTGVEEFPITNVLQERRQEPESLSKLPEEKRASVAESEKFEVKTFRLDQFDAVTATTLTKRVQHEEVEQYLDRLWSYETEVVDAVIARMEERERQCFSGQKA
jgi:hypothetical protein